MVVAVKLKGELTLLGGEKKQIFKKKTGVEEKEEEANQ